MASLVDAINLIALLLTLIILADIIVSYFMDPFHPIRQTLDSIVNPMLAPIRRVMPQVGMFDLSPIVLLLIIQITKEILILVITS
ncbi:MAG: YggT family protein [Anaerolineales bacterium]|nr:YggT family protein [Anaerolineales bacterium]